MKVKKMIKWLKELPPDYEMCFTEYASIVVGSDSTDAYVVVLDMPIVGMIAHEDTKEVRFFTQSSEESIIKRIEGGENWRKLE